MKSETPSVRILNTEVLSDNWYTLNKVTYEITKTDGSTSIQNREAYDRGNGAAILLYNRLKGTVVLTRQFRLPTYVNGNADGMLIEVCAGLLDDDSPEECIRRETMEETSYQIGAVRKLFEAYMSPGSVTEIIHFFVAEYSSADLQGSGGGVDDEDIKVLEMPFAMANEMMADGRIKDAKTIMLLQYAKIHDLLLGEQ